MSKFEQYGLLWPQGTTHLQVEMSMIRRGGIVEKDGVEFGLGLPFHYEEMRKILWPELDSHRWHRLCLSEIRRKNAKVTVLLGPGSSGKTHEAAWNYLCEYFCFPDETLVMVSSTDIRGLELRVWGEIKMLHEKAVDRFPELQGTLIESKHAISTDSIDEDGVRDLRKGIIGIPTVQGGKTVGLGKWVGCKQKRVRLIADEAQFMNSSFLSAFTNLDKNIDFQAIVLGNPTDMLDPLGTAAEPVDGWSSHIEPEKTEVWDTKFMNGRCVNLVGTDSPNFDQEKTLYPYLISKEKIDRTLSFYQLDSLEYYSQCKGVMKVGIMARRVITRDLCKKFGALNKPIWQGDSAHKHIVALDSAYGGDRCVLTEIEEGKDVDGKVVLSVVNKVIVPVIVSSNLTPEDQIAVYCKDYCTERSIPPENFFHDSTGRGTLGTALARVWSAKCNPVEFGGAPTNRPVSLDLFVYDEKTTLKRLKRCDEHYSKLVTEFWYSVRYAIESGQLKNLPEDTMEEGCMREWDMVRGDKIEIESKIEMKLRVGRSPDLFDSLAIAVEGARRLGFQISKMAKAEVSENSPNWIRDLHKKNLKLAKSRQLQSAGV